MGSSMKKGKGYLVIYHEGDLVMPAITLSAAGCSTLYLFRRAILAQNVKTAPQVLLILGGAVCLLVGLFLLLRALSRILIDKRKQVITTGILWLPLRSYPFETLGAVAVDVNHDYLYDRENGRPIIRRRRFNVAIVDKRGRALFPIAEIRDYVRAMAFGRELVKLTGLSLRRPKRVRHIPLEETILQ